MMGMFCEAFLFDRDISGWNVGRVVNMKFMFATTCDFDQDISGWNVSAVTEWTDIFARDEDADPFDLQKSPFDTHPRLHLRLPDY
jgi:hypothetical protein